MRPLARRLGVVVLTWNRRAEVQETLARLAALGQGLPTVLVDNGSTDGTAEAVAVAFPNVTVVRLPRNVGAAARNAGVEKLRTPYVAFCDDDTWWMTGALEHAVDVLDAHPRLGVVTAHVRVEPGGRDDPTSARMAASPFPNVLGVPGTALFGLLAGACVVRRDAFQAAGGYAPQLFIGGEEGLLAIDLAALGWHMAYLPAAVVCHRPSLQRDAGRRRALHARNRIWYAWLRRPWRDALACSLRELAAARGHRVATLAGALAGIAFLARERRVAPPDVQVALRTLDAFTADMERLEADRATSLSRARSSAPSAARPGATSVEGRPDSTHAGPREPQATGWEGQEG